MEDKILNLLEGLAAKADTIANAVSSLKADAGDLKTDMFSLKKKIAK